MKSKKKLGVFFNASFIGGAERSLVYQIALVRNIFDHIVCHIPVSEKTSEKGITELIDFIKKNIPEVEIKTFSYGSDLYKVSRSSFVFVSLKLIFSFFNLIANLSRLHLSQFDYLWANGNKIALPLVLSAFWTNYQGVLLWHFRDYPNLKFPFGYIWKVLYLPWSFKIKSIGNSFSVARAIEMATQNKTSAYTVYNPVGEKIERKKGLISSRPILGIVAMLAPWKGQEQIFYVLRSHEKELQELGATEIHFYGEAIYQTEGEHQRFDKKLEKMIQDYKGSLTFKLMGPHPVTSIFKTIDILLHTSIREEPFGRVIIEAFAAGVPVISTGLGGAGELILDEKTGFLASFSTSKSWIESLEKMLKNQFLREKIIQNSIQFTETLDTTVKNQLERVFTT